MKKYLLLFVLLASSDILFAGAYLGYLYPSGGQRGTTVRVIAGGQGLRGKITILCSNPGVKLKSAAVVPNMGYFPGQQRTWLINYLKNIYAGKNEMPPYPEKKDEQGWRKNSFLEKLADLPPLERSIVAHSVYVRINSLQAAPAISGRVILDLEISPDAPTGPCRLRLVSGRSISNEKLFFIDSDRQIIEPLYTPPFLPDLIYLAGIKDKAVCDDSSENPHIFRFDLIAYGVIENMYEFNILSGDTEFFGKFPFRSGKKIFSRSQMSSDGSIPFPRLDIFGSRTFLQQQRTAFRMDDNNVRGTVDQRRITVTPGTRCGADVFSGSVVDVEKLFHISINSGLFSAIRRVFLPSALWYQPRRSAGAAVRCWMRGC